MFDSADASGQNSLAFLCLIGSTRSLKVCHITATVCSVE